MIGAGISLSSTPSVSKIGSTLFGTSAWSKESEKHAESIGLKLFAGSALLVALGFLASMI